MALIPRLMRPSRLLPLIIATALFMENTDSTVIATSLPMIARDIGVDPIALKLALTSYLVGLAIFIPISGWMADRFGAKRIFRAAHCGVHGGLALLRLGEFARRLRGLAVPPGHGRRHDGAGRPPGDPAQRAAERGRPGAGHPDHPGPDRPGPRARRSAASSPPISTGAGSSSSTSRSASSGSCCRPGSFPNIKEENIPPLDFVGFILSGVGLALLMLGFATGGPPDPACGSRWPAWSSARSASAAIRASCAPHAASADAARPAARSRPSASASSAASCSASASAPSRSCCR